MNDMTATTEGKEKTMKTETILSPAQMAVLDEMIVAALNATGGDFGCMDEINRPVCLTGMKKHALGAYITQLQTLGLVEVHEEHNVNGVRGQRVQQYTITDLGWVMGNYNPETKQPLTTKRPISVAVESGKEPRMATNVKAEVAKLVKKLLTLKDKSDAEGRKIRRILRKLGHKGGTGKGPGRKPAKKVKLIKRVPKAPVKKAPKMSPPTAAPLNPVDGE